MATIIPDEQEVGQEKSETALLTQGMRLYSEHHNAAFFTFGYFHSPQSLEH